MDTIREKSLSEASLNEAAAIIGMSRSNLAQIFLKDDRPSTYVHCPEWGGHIKLVAMTGDQAEKFAAERNSATKKGTDTGTGMYDIIGACAVDEDGAKIFPDPLVLRGRSLSVLNRLQNAALRLNGFKEDAVEQAKNG